MPDIITVTSGTAGQPGNIQADVVNYIWLSLLEVAELYTVLKQFGQKAPLPSNASTVIQFVREEKLVVPTSPVQLVEGVPPDANPITLTPYTATVEQYGQLIRISDLAELTARHAIVERSIYILGLFSAELYDLLIFNVLSAATNTYRPNGKTSNATTTATDTIGYTDLVSLSALMMDQGARPFSSGDYVFVTPPQAYGSLQLDPDWKASVQFKAPERIWDGEVGSLAGFRVVRSNAPGFLPTTQTTSGAANLIYGSFALGQFAYQVTDLQNLQIYVVPPGGQADPLMQSRKIGMKFAFKSVITNQNWLRAAFSAGLNSQNN